LATGRTWIARGLDVERTRRRTLRVWAHARLVTGSGLRR
jgi:hypothetical protein